MISNLQIFVSTNSSQIIGEKQDRTGQYNLSPQKQIKEI